MQKLIDAATDPRFLGIMEEFACLQGTTLWKDETQARIVVGTHLRNFLTVIRGFVMDQHILDDLALNLVHGDTAISSVPEAVLCLDAVLCLLVGEHMDDALTALQVLRQRLGPAALQGDPGMLFDRVDEILSLLGVQKVSCRSLWEELGATERSTLERTLFALLSVIEEHSAPV